MVDRRKNKDAKWKANIARSLRQKGNKIRKGAKKVASKAVPKTAGAAGYALGRFGDQIDSVADKAGKKLRKAESTDIGRKASDKLKKAKDRVDSKKLNKAVNSGLDIVNSGLDKLERGTRVKAIGSATKGYVKGKIDAERKNKRN